jgi:hypothetical protein
VRKHLPAETVVDVGGFRIFLRFQLEDSDGVGDAILFQKLVAELIQYVFVEIVMGQLGSFPFLVLGDGGVDVSVAYGFAQVADKGVLRGGEDSTRCGWDREYIRCPWGVIVR